jgi:hypothetical protein
MSGPLGHEKQVSRIPPRQHEDESAHLRREGPKQQPQHREIVGSPLDGAAAAAIHLAGVGNRRDKTAVVTARVQLR